MPPMKLHEDKTRTRPLVIVPTDFAMYKIAVLGGGIVPNVLRGTFTSERYAEAALDKYNAA